MQRFKDKTGSEHTIEVTVATLRRVKKATGYLLTDLVTKETEIEKLDPIAMYEVLYHSLETTISIDELAGRLDDASGQAAMNALLEATIDFFPEPRRSILREGIRKVMAVGAEAEKRLMTAMEQAVRSPAFDAHLQKTFGLGSTSSPASSGSTPGRGRSGSSSSRGTRKSGRSGTAPAR